MDRIHRRLLTLGTIVAAVFVQHTAGAGEEPGVPRGLTGVAAFRLEAHLGHRTMLLAEAIPAESYDWRPAENVRSVAELFKHVASSYYWFGVQLGADKPADLPDWDQVVSKQQILGSLSSSLDFAREAILNLTPEDLDQEIDFFGRRTTRAELVLNLMTHGSEHLGQAIAYARALGVEPPWSDS